MDELHEMVCDAETPTQAVFICAIDGCGRRVVVGKGDPGLTVIDRGDASARHVGSIGGLSAAARVLP